ncbi:winged helix DNA-binding protein [Cohnella sp. CFH 77786]|nr:winged helix DNA-binding protein [Cohnella sp. CFH 77786]
MNHVADMQKRIQAEGEDEERRWMMTNTSDVVVIDFLKEATVLMLHVVDAIGESEPVNGVTISKRFGIPRGSVSKITRRLAEQGIIQAESLPDNKKEVLFRLTPTGRQIFMLHQMLHAHIDGNVREFLGQYDLDQIRFLARCMKDMAEASWVRLEEDKVEPEEGKEITELSNGTIESTWKTEELSDILVMLRQLDAKGLRKAKELIRIAFFDN